MGKNIFQAAISVAMAVCVLLAANSVKADNSKVTYPPVPEWVQEVNWEASQVPASDPKSSGTQLILYECQNRPKAADDFVRVVRLMENENGVQDSGSLRIGFYPEFQELQIHRVLVHRNGKTINRLDKAKVRLIQQEDNLGNHLITGWQTAVIFIEDLRVGDVLEYAYTVRGANPVLAGHFSTRFMVDGSGPVGRERFRVLWEEKNPLRQKLRAAAVADVKKLENGWDYVWDFTNLPPVMYEDYQPADFEAYSYVEVSDFADWGSVVDWALPLYEFVPTNLPPDLSALLQKWKSTAYSDEEKARVALEFVQDDLRYTGIELGPDSYRPANPIDTFEKRYGDCKGKVVLLRLLLKELGIDSAPALVDSYDRAGVLNRLPTPFAFNHVILRIKLRDKYVWVDPTISQQGGMLWERHLPSYGQALIIDHGTTFLEQVPRDRPEFGSRQDVKAHVFITGYDKPAALKIRTEHTGYSADQMRDSLASTRPADLANNYLNYYSRMYPGISIQAPFKFTDSRVANKLVIEESYIITNLWEKQAKKDVLAATFYAESLYGILTDPQTRIRKTPLALSYPLIRHQHITVQLPDDDWSISAISTNIENVAFSFSYGRNFKGRMLELDYLCKTKLATIPIEQVSSYLTDRERMEDLLTDTLSQTTGHSGAINWVMVLIAIFGAGACVIGCLWYWNFSKTKAPLSPPVLEKDPLNGLSGWLILVGFGICLAPFVRLFSLGSIWHSYFSADVWQAVATPAGESYHVLYAPMLMMEMLGNISLLVLNAFVLFLFFTKRRIFPAVYILMMISNALFLIVDDVFCALIPSIGSSNHKDAIRAVFTALIWCSYMLKSKRVKATFIR